MILTYFKKKAIDVKSVFFSEKGYYATAFVRNSPTKLAADRLNTVSVFGQFQNSEISDADWHL